MLMRSLRSGKREALHYIHMNMIKKMRRGQGGILLMRKNLYCGRIMGMPGLKSFMKTGSAGKDAIMTQRMSWY